MKRIYKITTELDTETQEEAESKIKMLFIGKKIIDVENVKEQRSNLQNNSIHLWLDQIAKDCIEKGITMKMILEKRIEIMPTGLLLKESIWKFTQRKMFNKKSTTQLNKTGEIDDIVDVLTLHFSELGADVPPFPSNEFFI